ncbi:pimeloyl-ACP methyl ester carboxylesterase [Pseudomonas citronellolis]|uniref:alpha/beta hydrolase n=1 Tax=Pseudomonas citronellolis TaxID=53408 RepID=UPI0020A0DDD2|nr:alpha/beta hydrolase [Pseudomonas citronellolis]MCP1644932.1 pimeloyl-ACP methyl ester carboxylesterase [Pseudomonas citronellolis]MCP1667877.1 pimeloyl-ACP methyl ester carboxylesterase [Pseudomonas citronellolis]MCP1699027.1 pimeloyl-ACP methyl ester carboxylesterase [Pseudomonas citronellolis]MCP1704984.1 pimeloyl-ACP methyl ester carboxylesterase [Pseudomonas citronellolis]MCP1799590.1 pimeloyl-ACP methyl ester carboxylesterase [Pseudomonas citronellolis]
MSNHLSGPRRWAGFLQALTALLLGALLAGCQSPREALQQLADAHGRKLEILPGRPFPLAVLAPQDAEKSNRLRVYLEGDGHAWATATQPSLDPSPQNLLVAQLSVDDPTPNAYLARPCQFVTTPACEPSPWTNRRFSQEVVTRLSQALDQLKQRYGNREFELVGYSGGATLALLLAAQREDVAQVQTVAGNLSPRLWAQMKELSPLNGSLDPLDYRDQLAAIPQRHLVGDADDVVPTSLANAYLVRLHPYACSQVVLSPAADHQQGWEAFWKTWRDKPLNCESNRPQTRTDSPSAK